MPVVTCTDPNAAGSWSLSEEDVSRLLEDRTPAALIGVTGKIAGAYAGQTLPSTEAAAAEQVFRLLLRETEIQVRVALAEQIKSSDVIPKDIVLALAQDVAQVSLPILQYSEVLSDEDLLGLIRGTDEVERCLAIARRDRVSDAVSGALIDKDSEEVAACLLDNPGASIREDKLAGIIARYPENTSMMRAMSLKRQLPVTVAEKLINVVSSSLGETLKEKYRLPAGEIAQEVDKARESETLKLIGACGSGEDVDRLVGQLQSFDRLSPSIILSALCCGHFDFFETSLARLSHIPVSNARALIADRGDLGFRAIYNKSGLPEPMFAAVRLLLKVVRALDDEGTTPGGAHYANRVVERLLQHAEQEPVENLSYIIALVRRGVA